MTEPRSPGGVDTTRVMSCMGANGNGGSIRRLILDLRNRLTRGAVRRLLFSARRVRGVLTSVFGRARSRTMGRRVEFLRSLCTSGCPLARGPSASGVAPRSGRGFSNVRGCDRILMTCVMDKLVGANLLGFATGLGGWSVEGRTIPVLDTTFIVRLLV